RDLSEVGDRARAVDERGTRARHPAGGSGQALPRHPPAPAYRCFIPDLTGFTSWRRAGPDLQRPVPRAAPDPPGLGRGFGPARADCGCRAPLAPRLARSPRWSIAVRSGSQIVGFVLARGKPT